MSYIIYRYLYDCLEYLEEMAQLWHEEIGEKFFPKRSLEETAARFGVKPGCLPITIVASNAQGEFAGTCSLCIEDEPGIGSSIWLSLLLVAKQYRGKGIAQILMDKIENIACDMQYYDLYLGTMEKNLISYYNKFDWHLIGAVTCSSSHPILVMQKHLK